MHLTKCAPQLQPRLTHLHRHLLQPLMFHVHQACTECLAICVACLADSARRVTLRV